MAKKTPISENAANPDAEDTHLDAAGKRRFGVGGLSDVGRVREANEDNWHWEPLDGETALYAVADGMGGHDRGELASQIAVETLFEATRDLLGKSTDREVLALRKLMRESFQTANRAVVSQGAENDSNMGTTLCAALVHRETHAIIGNVGDSRVYLVREGALEQVSQDHSLVAYLVELGELTAAEARNHPSGNILVRSIGSVDEVEIDLYHLKTKPGDRIILCSDGLWGEVDDVELESVMAANPNAQDACEALVDLANDHGGRDNTTLVVVNL